MAGTADKVFLRAFRWFKAAISQLEAEVPLPALRIPLGDALRSRLGLELDKSDAAIDPSAFAATRAAAESLALATLVTGETLAALKALGEVIADLQAGNAEVAAVIERLRHTPFVEPKPEQAGLQGFMFHPRGDILRLTPAVAGSLLTTDFLRLEDEEVPREGIELKRAFNYARDASGRALLWIGRSKTSGRGEGASGLSFDRVRRSGRV